MHPELKRNLAHYASRDFLSWDHATHSAADFRELCRTGLPTADHAGMDAAFDGMRTNGAGNTSLLYFAGRELQVREWAADLGWKPADLVKRLAAMPIRQALKEPEQLT